MYYASGLLPDVWPANFTRFGSSNIGFDSISVRDVTFFRYQRCLMQFFGNPSPWASDFGLQMMDFGLQTSDFGLQMSDFLHLFEGWRSFFDGVSIPA